MCGEFSVWQMSESGVLRNQVFRRGRHVESVSKPGTQSHSRIQVVRMGQNHSAGRPYDQQSRARSFWGDGACRIISTGILIGRTVSDFNRFLLKRQSQSGRRRWDGNAFGGYRRA